MTEQEKEWFEKLHNQKEKDKEVLLRPDYIGLWKSVIDKYSDKAHFIYELIQNADDARATFIRFDLQKDGLWVLHNGKERFLVTDPDDNTSRGHINSITSIGVSTKIDEQKIGKFGVGFKAVFAYTETPEIYDNFNFIIENYIVPTEIEPTDYERKANETLFHFPFDKPQKPAREAYDEILGKLKILIYPTLFLSNLEDVSWKTETENGKYLKKAKQAQREGNMFYEKVELLQEIGLNATNEMLWLFKRYIEEEKEHSYSVGFFLDEKGKLEKKQLDAFCFFPTKENTGLNFIVHAPFLLNDSREGIKEDNWNKELLHKLAELAADSLLILKGLKLIDDNIIYMIPYEHSADFSEQFYHKIKSKFETEELLPTRNGEFAKKENAYWIEYDYISLLSDEQISDLMLKPNSRLVFCTMNENNVSRESSSDKKDYINSITSGVLRTSGLLSKITDIFIKKQSFSWLHNFYESFLKTDEHKKSVKTKPIFKDENGNAVPAFDVNGHLILFLPTGEKNDYTTIHPELLNNENSKEFIEKFGIKQPSLKDEIDNHILPLYNNTDDINPTDSASHFRKFLNYYNECHRDESDNFINRLKNEKVVAYKCNANNTYHFDKADEIYYPTEDLLKYFENKPDTKFLDLEFYRDLIEEKEELLDEFFRKLRMNYCPKIIKIKLNEQQIEKYGLRNYINRYFRNNCFYSSMIDNFSDFLKSIDIAKSLLLWKNLINVIENNTLKTVLHTYTYYQKPKFDYHNDIPLYTSDKWLLNKNNELVSAQELCIDDLSSDYDTTSECAKKLIEFLKIKEQPIDENAAKKLGFENAEQANQAKRLLELSKKDRRIKKIIEDYTKAQPKTFESRVITIRTSGPENPRSYLQEQYTNDDYQLICQICREEMPFRKKNKEYYFEIIEIFSKVDILDKEMEVPYLALCPVCAAKYRNGGFIDKSQKNEIKKSILNENIVENKENYEIPISLDRETTIRFVAKHFIDLKTILELSNSSEIDSNKEKAPNGLDLPDEIIIDSNETGKLEELIRTVGMEAFVKYYELFASNDYSVGNIAHTISLKENYTINSCRTKASIGKKIFREHLEKEALNLISQSNRVDNNAREKANKLLANKF